MYQCTVLIIKYCFAHITLMVVLIKFALSLSIYIYANSPKQVNYMYLETACLIELRSFRQRVVSPTVSSPTSRVDSPTCRFANCQFAFINFYYFGNPSGKQHLEFLQVQISEHSVPFEHILRIYIFLTCTGLFSSITLEILQV